MRRVGIYEARSKLGELVRLAAAGEKIIIEVRGKPAAQLAPVETAKEGAAEAVDWFVKRAKARKPWKVPDRQLVIEGRPH